VTRAARGQPTMGTMTRLLAGASARMAPRLGGAGSRGRWVAVAGAVLATGCIIGVGFVIAATDDSDGPGTNSLAAGTPVTVDVYFITSQAKLASEQVTMDSTGDRGVDAVTALIYAQPTEPNHTNAWSIMAHGANDTADAGAGVLSVSHADGVVTVELDSHVPEGAPIANCPRPGACPLAPSGTVVLQQLVYTVQAALDTTDPVVLTDQGDPARMVFFTSINGPIEAHPNALAPGRQQ
jgi:hypothetical protein